MELIINDFAAFIGRRSERFYVRIPEKEEQEFAADKVEQIIIARGSSLSMGAIELAMDRDIDIVYLDWRGMPIAILPICHPAEKGHGKERMPLNKGSSHRKILAPLQKRFSTSFNIIAGHTFVTPCIFPTLFSTSSNSFCVLHHTSNMIIWSPLESAI